MSRSPRIRLDDGSVAALRNIRGGSVADAKAVRTALLKLAARSRARSSIAAEVAQLAADEDDRFEMRALRQQMTEFAPDLVD